MKRELGKGDKCSITGNPIDMGLSSREGYEHNQKLRSDTGEESQRPVGKDKKMSSDRGTFTDKG